MMQRRILGLEGADVLSFLQGLVTNDVLPLAKAEGLVWAALLTPQGKYLADFFVGRDGTGLFLDLPEALADDVIKRLTLYRLRADVRFSPRDAHLRRGLGPAPKGALRDPRHPALGWRLYGAEGEDAVDWEAIRVAHVIPETLVELIPNETYVLEAGFDRLHGVDFRKGCYVGQEVTARMKHKTELRKGLVAVEVAGEAEIGTPILSEGKEAGTLFTRSGDRAIAWLRFDRMGPEMVAATAKVRPVADFS